MSKRVSFELPGVEHTHPIPGGCRIGSFLITSVVSGKDPGTGAFPEGIEGQCAQMFANVRRLIEAASGTPEDILKMTVWMKDLSDRKHLNKEWLALFPDPESRPARHTFVSRDLVEPILVECEFMAVVSGG